MRQGVSQGHGADLRLHPESFTASCLQARDKVIGSYSTPLGIYLTSIINNKSLKRHADKIAS